MALDRFGRRIHYLRISLTDHCNLRCIYCMPEDVTFLPNTELMQDEEILALVRIFAGLGFDKIRLTGGEPTVRAGIVKLVRQIAHTPGIRTLTMTSNGVFFKSLARSLAEAGLNRANFSLDTLDAKKFRRLTRRGSLEDVWEGIDAAEQAGLTPIKINTVVVRDYSESDVIDLAGLTIDHAWQVRFIEMMPFGGATNFQLEGVVRAAEVKANIESNYGPLEPLNGSKLDGEAEIFRIPGGAGEIGFISTISQPFCSTCSRVRLTADGRLRLCLLHEHEVDLLTPLRSGMSERKLHSLISDSIWQKPWGNGLTEGRVPLNRAMSQIGG